MAKRSDITLEKILTDYQEALALAREQQKPNEMVNAATAQAKLCGLLRDRVETGNVGDFDNMDLSEIVETVATEAGPEAAQALIRALGMEQPKAEEKTSVEPNLAALATPSDAVN